MKRAVVFVAAAGGAVLLSAGSAFAASGPQSFTLTRGGGQQQTSLVGSGVIHGQGTDHVISNNTDRFKFSQGSVLVNHAPTTQQQGPQVGCVTFYRENGTYQLAGGTGAYTGAGGGGTYQLQDVFFAKPTANGCSNAGHDLLVIHATGTTTLP